MGCQVSLAMTEAILGETPIDDAVYVASVDKIFGTIGPHIAKFNATTGAFESAVRVFGPAMGNCRICYHAPLDTIFISVWNVLSRQWSSLDWSIRGLYPINPATMAIGGVVDTDSFAALSKRWTSGPQHVFSPGFGTNLYFTQYNSVGVYWWRVNPTNIADRANPSQGVTFDGDNCYHQYATDGLNMYGANTYNFEVQRYDMALTNGSFGRCRINAPQRFVDNPVSCAFSTGSGECYAVCGTAVLIRCTSFVSPGAYAAHAMNSGTVTGMPPGTVVKPTRMRYRSSDASLYIPCPQNNGVIIWDTGSNDGEWKSGFDYPIDVVITPTKAFAVQLGNNGLKEIV